MKNKPMGMLIMILALVLVAVILVIVIVASAGGEDETTPIETTTVAPTSTTDPATTSTTPDSSTTEPPVSSTEKPTEEVKPTPAVTEKADESGKITVPSADAATGLLIEVSATNPYQYDLENIFKGDENTTADDIAASDYKRLVSGDPLWKTANWKHYVRKETFEALNAMITTFASHAGTQSTLRIFGYMASMSADVTNPFITGNAISMYSLYGGEPAGLNYSLNKVNVDGNMVTYNKWFEKYATDFGFVFEGLRGEDQNMLPGYFRYYGTVHAAGVASAGSLSAYLAGIKDGTITTATAADGSTWNLSYVAASTEDTTEITVGASATYTISGDNMGGFIVAVLAK